MNPFKVIFGTVQLCGPMVAGIFHMTPIIILPLTGLFIIARLIETKRGGDGRAALRPLPTLLTELAVVALFFAMSYGVSSLTTDTTPEVSPLVPLALSAIGLLRTVPDPRAGRQGAAVEGSEEASGTTAQPGADTNSFPADSKALFEDLLTISDDARPMDILRLARKLTETGDQKEVSAAMIAHFATLTNASQQRVFYTYFRFHAKAGHTMPDIRNQIQAGLDADDPAVADDAAWTYQAIGQDDDAIIATLRRMASDRPRPETVAPDDDAAHFDKRIHDILDKFDGLTEKLRRPWL